MVPGSHRLRCCAHTSAFKRHASPAVLVTRQPPSPCGEWVGSSGADCEDLNPRPDPYKGTALPLC